MNKLINDLLKIDFRLLVITSVFYALPAAASDWWENADLQSGFSEFAPPSSYSNYDNHKFRPQWRSGSSFNDVNKVRYLPVESKKNPWQVVSKTAYKKTFSSQRPWGNVPEKRPSKTSSMKFYDQRFKEWSHQLDSSYQNSLIMADPLSQYGRSLFPLTSYAYPRGLYGNPLFTPAVYPAAYYPGNYGLYPATNYPVSGFYNRPLWSW